MSELIRRAGRLLCLGLIVMSGLMVEEPVDIAYSQTACPDTPGDLLVIVQSEPEPAVRAHAAECFVQKAIEYDYPDLKLLVHTMLRDEDSADVRFHAMGILVASFMAARTTPDDLNESSAKIIQILKEDPVARNKAGAAALIGEMEPIPANQVEQTLLDLVSNADSSLADAALGTLLQLDPQPREELAPRLMTKFEHSDPLQRALAAEGLGFLYRDAISLDSGIVEALIVALQDSDRYVKIQAAQSLMRIGSLAAPAVPDLRRIAWDPKEPPAVRHKAQEAEEAITGEPTRAPWADNGSPPSPPPGYSGAQ